MLTAVTPLAQELTAERSEASPPKAAPYPREVGTAMMGFPTRPAMTEKSEASMPATARMTSARSISSRRERRRSTPATPTSGTIVEATPRYSSARRASEATGMSEVPAVTTATVPSTRGMGLPTERCRVSERGS
jgi:hypothetical protein